MAQADCYGSNISNGFDDLQVSENTESDTEFDSSWKTIGPTRRYNRKGDTDKSRFQETLAAMILSGFGSGSGHFNQDQFVPLVHVNRRQNVVRETTAVSHPANVKDTQKPVHGAFQYGSETMAGVVDDHAQMLSSKLFEACLMGFEEIMEELLKAGADPNRVSGCHRQSVMHLAASAGVMTLSMIRRLIAYGADVNLRDADEKTILHYLVEGKFNDTDDNLFSAVTILLDKGADGCRDTLLFRACLSGKVDLANLLIAEGADVNIVIGLADIHCELIDVLNVLVNAGPNIQISPAALAEPCNTNDHALIRRILDKCEMDINMTISVEGLDMTILQFASSHCEIDYRTVQILLEYGADVRAVSDTGDTALHYAVSDTVETAGCYAVCCGSSKIPELLSYNPPLNVQNNENQTPLAKLIMSLYRISDQNTYAWAAWFRIEVLEFKMLVIAGANVTPGFEKELDQIRIKQTETQIPIYEAISTRSLKEMCRFVIRETIPVPVDFNLGELPIPKILQEYLNFPEIDPLADECLKVAKDYQDNSYN